MATLIRGYVFAPAKGGEPKSILEAPLENLELTDVYAALYGPFAPEIRTSAGDPPSLETMSEHSASV